MGVDQARGAHDGWCEVNITIVDHEQRSPEWFAARLGRLTGSRAADMLAKIKTGEAAARRDLRTQLVCERLTGCVQEDAFVSKDMQRGTELEPAAFVAYEAETGAIVRRTGFIQAADLMIGCSLDGDVDNLTGIVELKCPRSANHLRYLKNGVLPSEHVAQVTHNLWVTGAEFADFVSFDPRFPQALQVFRVRVTRREVDLAGYEAAALAFLAEVDREFEDVAGLARSVA
jgi:hypothetical protein